MPLTVEDRVEMMELVARYNQAIDSGDAEGYAATFTEDGVFQIAGQPEVRGREQLIDMVQRLGPRNSRHWVNNIVIDGDGDSATMKCYLAVLRDRQITSTGKYVNILVRVDGSWKFLRRDYTGDPRPDRTD